MEFEFEFKLVAVGAVVFDAERVDVSGFLPFAAVAAELAPAVVAPDPLPLPVGTVHMKLF